MISEYKESTSLLNHIIGRQKIEIESLGEIPRFKWGKCMRNGERGFCPRWNNYVSADWVSSFVIHVPFSIVLLACYYLNIEAYFVLLDVVLVLLCCLMVIWSLHWFYVCISFIHITLYHVYIFLIMRNCFSYCHFEADLGNCSLFYAQSCTWNIHNPISNSFKVS